ncbi:MAG: amino acid ABC transporter substrate-binding protein [bacterium]|nr:amino acid ABC transporter substrate-binding protein [bacterium]
MTRTRSLVLAAAVASVALVAAACGGDDEATTAPPPAPPAGTAAPAPPADTAAPAPPADTAAPAPPAETAEDEVTLSQAGGRLAEVQARGSVRCGVRDALPGFNFLTPDGEHEGFDSDFCRVIAAAVLGDAGAVDFVDLATADRFTALQSGEIDVLVRNTTFTASRDGKEAANFVYTTLYDGQGVVVPASTGITDLEGLADANICVAQGTTTELNLTDVMRSRNIPFNPVTFGESSEARVGYTAGQCEAFTSDKSSLAVFKYEIEDSGGDEQFILPETISKEPLGPAVLDGDTEWAQVVQWAVMATIQAWEFGLDSGNIASATGDNPALARFLGEEGFDPGIGLPSDFAVQVVSQVGNYEEIYERHLEPLGLPLHGSVNDLWTHGGLMYVPPYR